MATIYENVTPTLIPNTTMQRVIRDGVHKQYYIYPNEGYVLHDNASDYTDIDPDTGEEITVLTYYTGMCSCGKNYDFDNTIVIDGYTAYGSREFFARPATEVPDPDNQIFGGVTTEPEHEIM